MRIDANCGGGNENRLRTNEKGDLLSDLTSISNLI